MKTILDQPALTQRTIMDAYAESYVERVAHSDEDEDTLSSGRALDGALKG